MSWPKKITWPMPSQFVAESWATDKDGELDATDGVWHEYGEMPAQDMPCGSRFCLVGWIRHEFGHCANPHSGEPMGREGMRMLKQVAQELGLNPSDNEIDLAEEIAQAVDGTGYRPPMTPRAACRLMRRVVQHFGYEKPA